MLIPFAILPESAGVAWPPYGRRNRSRVLRPGPALRGQPVSCVGQDRSCTLRADLHPGLFEAPASARNHALDWAARATTPHRDAV